MTLYYANGPFHGRYEEVTQLATSVNEMRNKKGAEPVQTKRTKLRFLPRSRWPMNNFRPGENNLGVWDSGLRDSRALGHIRFCPPDSGITAFQERQAPPREGC